MSEPIFCCPEFGWVGGADQKEDSVDSFCVYWVGKPRGRFPCTLCIVLLRGSRIGMGFLRPDEF